MVGDHHYDSRFCSPTKGVSTTIKYTMSRAELDVLREENRKLNETLTSLQNHNQRVPPQQELQKLDNFTSMDYYEDENGGCLWNCGLLPVKPLDEKKKNARMRALIRGEVEKKDRDLELIRQHSALRIQGVVRGVLVREEIRNMIRTQSAIFIQAAARGMVRRAEISKELPALERARRKRISKTRKATRERKRQQKLEKKMEMKKEGKRKSKFFSSRLFTQEK